MPTKLFSSLALCGALVCAAGSARAGGVDPANATPVDVEQANAHFKKGKDAYEKNDMTTALTEFRASLDIVASPNARLYVARTLRELGRVVEAYEEFGRTAADAKEHEREDGRYGKAAQAALAERSALSPQLGFVVLTVKNSNDSTTVNVSGSKLVRAGWSDPVPVKPGNVEIEVDTPGVAPIRKSLTVTAGNQVPMSLDAMAPSAVQANPVQKEAPPETHADNRWMLTAAIVGGGAGVVGMLTFTIAGLASNATYADLQNKCASGPCPYPGEVTRGEVAQTAANIGLVVGIVGLVAGATFFTLWVLPHNHAAQPSAALLVGPGSLGVAGTF